VGGERTTTGKVVNGTHSTTDTSIRGWTWTMPGLSNLNVELGRSFTQVEDEHSTPVAIVGADIVDNVLGAGDPLGKTVRVDGLEFRVIGVGERQGKMLGMSMDNWVAIPLTAFLHKYGSHQTMTVYVDAGSGGAVMEATQDELRTIMRARRHLGPAAKDAFSIDSSATFQNLLGQILNNFGAVVAAIASISLVVGGIVIMNIMLVSVTERTREIGIRKAMGARSDDILLQFLIESLTLALLGGAIGVLFGISFAKVVTLAIGMPSEIKLWAVLAGVFVAASVGIFFGVYPAKRAAVLDPIAALRFET
jgi:putative ABC transport system permease protein